jgi:hypothetical protein
LVKTDLLEVIRLVLPAGKEIKGTMTGRHRPMHRVDPLASRTRRLGDRVIF